MAVAVLVAYGVYVALFICGVCWCWPDFVDGSDPERVRRILFLVGFMLTLEEGLLYLWDVLSGWSYAIAIFCNVWGLLDAFLRFPIVHDLDSFFALKQLFLILFKIAGYLLGIRNLTKNLPWAVLLLLINVCTVPIMWLTALPIGDVNSYHQKHHVKDEDLALRLWRIAVTPSDATAMVAYLKVMIRKFLAEVARSMPCLKPVILRLDPAMARILRKTRDVWNRVRFGSKEDLLRSRRIPICSNKTPHFCRSLYWEKRCVTWNSPLLLSIFLNPFSPPNKFPESYTAAIRAGIFFGILQPAMLLWSYLQQVCLLAGGLYHVMLISISFLLLTTSCTSWY